MKIVAHNLAVSSLKVLLVIAPVSIAIVEFVVLAANASIAFLNPDHNVKFVSYFRMVVVRILYFVWGLSLFGDNFI